MIAVNNGTHLDLYFTFKICSLKCTKISLTYPVKVLRSFYKISLDSPSTNIWLWVFFRISYLHLYVLDVVWVLWNKSKANKIKNQRCVLFLAELWLKVLEKKEDICVYYKKLIEKSKCIVKVTKHKGGIIY